MAALHCAGRTAHGHFLLRAGSKTVPGLTHDALVSRDGTRVSCDCMACNHHRDARADRLTVRRVDVLAGRVIGCCWHLRHAARVAPLLLAHASRQGSVQ